MAESINKKNNSDFSEDNLGNSFIEFITILVKHRFFLLTFVFGITITVTVFALLAPKWYKSVSTVLPAEQTDFLGGLSGLSSLVKGFSASKGLASLTGNSETDKYIAILQSGTLLDRVINKFNLRKEYDMEDSYYDKVVKELMDNVDFEIQDEGQLTITVFDKNPQQAADMANFFVQQLNDINSQLHVQNAKANREFIEKRYLKNLEDIRALEDSMKIFQEKNGVVAVPEQLQTTVTAMATIYGQLAEKEIEWNVLNSTYGRSHPLSNYAQTEIRELRKKILEINEGSHVKDGEVNFLIPFKQAPKLAQEYLRVYRDLEIQYKILEFITPLYEQAKVEEVRNTPSVMVLDKAGPAERKAKPKGSLYALLSFVITGLLGIFIVFTKELFHKIKVSNPEKYNFILNTVKGDFKKFSRKR